MSYSYIKWEFTLKNLGSLYLYDVSGHYKLFGSQPTSFSNKQL